MYTCPEDVIKHWINAVNDGNVDGLCSLYTENAVLIPTFSSRILRTPDAIREYFTKLATRDELSLALHDKTLAIQTVHDGIFIISGIYCWRFAIDGEMLSFEARFNYMIDLNLERPILQHHSSQIPRVI
jgi:hypothetical protein